MKIEIKISFKKKHYTLKKFLNKRFLILPCAFHLTYSPSLNLHLSEKTNFPNENSLYLPERPFFYTFAKKLKSFILDGVFSLYLWSIFIFLYFKILVIYSNSVCFSHSQRFLYRSQSYCLFLIFYSSESSWYLSQAFSKPLPVFSILFGWWVSRCFYIRKTNYRNKIMIKIILRFFYNIVGIILLDSLYNL